MPERDVVAAGGPVFVDATAAEQVTAATVVATAQPATRLYDRELEDDDLAASVARTARGGDGPRRRVSGRAIVSILVVLAAVVGGGAFLVPRTSTHTLGDYASMSVAAARTELEGKGFHVDVQLQTSEAVPIDTVISQDPVAGTSLAEGRTVTLVVSSGPPPVAVPTNLAGMTVDQATAALAAAGLKVGALTDVYDESVAKGIVLSVAEGVGATMPKGSPIGLNVSAGPKPRTIPDGLVGKSIAEVTPQLESMGLKVNRIDDFSDTVPENAVISTNPAAGQTVPKGGVVDVHVSKGKKITIPANLVGQSCNAAASSLQALGLTVAINPFGAAVKSVSPAAGSVVKAGSTVTLACG